jgi:hypothetical protein
MTPLSNMPGPFLGGYGVMKVREWKGTTGGEVAVSWQDCREASRRKLGRREQETASQLKNKSKAKSLVGLI